MNLLYPVSLSFSSFLIAFTYSSIDNPKHFTADDVSINCGSIGTFAARNGRKWIGDVIKPKKPTSSLLQIQGPSSTVNHHKLIAAADPVPHKTARISRSRFSYVFRVSSGPKILRLHFNSAAYKGFKGLKELFTVEAGPFILLRNFSASLNADVFGIVNSFSKEYCLNIQENEQLNVTFSPETSYSYAFINGIEIISVPRSVSYFQVQGGRDTGVQVVGHNSMAYIDQYTALELIHRLNVERTSQFSGDFDGTLPLWDNVKNNETWKIAVGVGFRYLIRLHFTKTGLKIAAASGDVMMFKVLVNEMTVHTNIELVKEMDGDENNKIPWYKDYMVMLRGQTKEGKRDLSISIHSYDDLIDVQVLIAGFQIYKLSNHDNSLASPNPVPPALDSPSHTLQVLISILGHRNTCAFVAVTIISLISIIIHKLQQLWGEANSSNEIHKPSARSERLCRCFSLSEIELATRNFSDAFLIGGGGFGKVYKGLIDRGQTKTVAVKRLKSNSMQGEHEFLMEIETLSELRHVNLVSLIGYCNEGQEMILVYDYMSNGTLSDHLYKLSSDTCIPLLTWKRRLNICIGAGRGLDYLHTGHGVIHRDVKTSNILLDDNFIAKVSDFGLAKHEDRSKLQQSHISTRVKGTKGYLDPHYLYTRKLTRKTDTYAFGVVLLEVLCGRPVVDFSVAEDEHILTIWARDMINRGEADQIVASRLRKEISPASLKTFVEVAARCVRDEPKNRPTMSQVVHQLELALEQQESGQVLVLNENAIRPIGNDGNDLSGKPAMATSTNMQNQMTNFNNSKVVNDETSFPKKEGRNTMTLKLSRLWPWDGFRNRAKSSMKNDLSGKPAIATSTDMQNQMTNFNNSKVVNDEISYTRKKGRSTTMLKLSRLWPQDRFWNRVKLSTENQLFFTVEEDPAIHLRQLKRFSLRNLQVATDNFSNKNIIGRGGFGKVYKGRLADGSLVAVKRLKEERTQGGELQFQTEVEMISMAMHRNLLRLLGFCMTPKERLLVYPYMANGSVASCLRERPDSQPPLDWPKRKRIALGSGRGLAYLHDDCDPKIIHRDIKADNILLDEDFEAVVGDFGLAKLMGYKDTHVTTAVRGTIGHIAPEYLSTGQASEKTDVFGYGVMLLELVSGQRAFDLARLANDDDVMLLDWVKGLLKERILETLVDADLQKNYIDEEVEQLIQVALLCTQSSPKDRPKMSKVIRMLEGEGLAERWEEWQREEIFRQEAFNHRSNY